MAHGPMDHGTQTANMLCDDGYIGSIRLKCDDSTVSVASGVCFEHCGNGTTQGAPYINLRNDQMSQLICPEAGAVRVLCKDGVVEAIAGKCLSGCSAGVVSDVNSVPIQHAAMLHSGSQNGTCSDTGIGTVELSCNDTVVSVSSLATATGQRCQRHCPPQTLDIDPLQNITLETLSTFHQQRSQKEPAPQIVMFLLGFDIGAYWKLTRLDLALGSLS
ncbi:unnamed protein product [Polarella glacialis]|uniref:Uncharacterized protein n=1 Tax=Polarella glacialis TaxID=89957 RepID=A0A813IB36_POLGL|nr:unnamed protein product [Polarella glacialis]